MGTIAEKLTAVANSKADIASAITSKGGTVPTKFSDYGDAIRALPGGGGDNGKFVSLVERTISGAITAQDLQGATTIGRDGFSRCPITSIELPSTVTSISQSAFYQSTTLTSITIPNSVTNIGERAFYGCTGLTTIAIPDSMTHIESYAFQNCSNLYTIDFGSTRSDIPVLGESTAFNGLASGYRILVPESLLTDWKAASSWSSIASHIYPHIDFIPYMTYVVNAQGQIVYSEPLSGTINDSVISRWEVDSPIQWDGSETLVVGFIVNSITADDISAFFAKFEFLNRSLNDISGWSGYPWNYTSDKILFLDSSVDHTIK